jgi:class 3 adenylate cyclase
VTNYLTGIVTFLFTDIEGSTKLARENPETWEAARARHQAILHEAIESNNGFVFHIIGGASDLDLSLSPVHSRYRVKLIRYEM